MDMTREELDAKLEALEARSDAKFERLFAHLQTSSVEMRAELRAELQASHAGLSSKIDALAARSVDKITAAGLLLTAIALVFGMISFGGDQFNTGREISTAIAALDAKIDGLEARSPPPVAPKAANTGNGPKPS